ncbi:MAG: exosome complex protein Rrp42 [Candidatus Micrarchaeota archaeon]|nr:exosome complex protein Rrp42 [Candidatus Micrarchaeota archaeon]
MDSAEGSALAQIGNTKVLAGVKLSMMEPFADEPNKGVLIMGAELLPMASPTFEPGPPDERSIEFSRVVDRGIRSSEIINMESLFVEEGKVLGLFIDLYVLDYGGNLFDTGTLAAMSALKNTRMPKIESGELIRGEYTGNLPLGGYPLSSTFVKIGNFTMLDPEIHEESAADARLTICTCEENIVAMQKGGVGAFKKEEVLNLINVSFEKRDILMKHIR